MANCDQDTPICTTVMTSQRLETKPTMSCRSFTTCSVMFTEDSFRKSRITQATTLSAQPPIRSALASERKISAKRIIAAASKPIPNSAALR